VLLADEHTSVVNALQEGGRGSNTVKPAQYKGAEVPRKHGKAQEEGTCGGRCLSVALLENEGLKAAIHEVLDLKIGLKTRMTATRGKAKEHQRKWTVTRGNTDVYSCARTAKLAHLQRQNVIKTDTFTTQQTQSLAAAQNGASLKDPLGILLIERQQLTSALTELGEHARDTENLTLVAQTVLSAQLQLGVETLLLEGTTGTTVSCSVVSVVLAHAADSVWLQR
jgi:hypothetical protein